MVRKYTVLLPRMKMESVDAKAEIDRCIAEGLEIAEDF